MKEQPRFECTSSYMNSNECTSIKTTQKHYTRVVKDLSKRVEADISN